MKQFFKMMFASMLGFILTIIIVILILIGIASAIVSLAGKETVVVEKNSVLYMKLDNPIPDRTSDNPFDKFDFMSMKAKESLGLNDILKSIKNAAEDDNIKGIYLDLSIIPAGISTLEEIRNALLEFKKSKKFIISYSEMYDQATYYIASLSDKIYLNPQGFLLFKGISANYMFYKGTLEKLDIDMQVIRHGKYKSAVEPYISDKMSAANKIQTTEFIKSIWNNIVADISQSRNISISDLNNIADGLKIKTPEDALKYKFVDKLAYKDEVLADLAFLTGAKEINKIKSIALNKYANVHLHSAKAKGSKKEKIAVIYASGEIKGGEGDNKNIGSETISKAIRQARLDKSIKAVVLRVNSPGGSALASDVIWREVVLTKQAKPVVVSMGDVAASGGYYISCAANKIIADPNTITGSIGVFGIIPNIQGLLNKKLGITLDGVKTNENADFGMISRPLREAEKAVFEKEIETIYNTFLKHVSEGRKMTVAMVDSIAQGRVWSGVDAKRIGLVDDFGGLTKAVEAAAGLAKIKDYKVINLPAPKDIFKQLFENFASDTKQDILKKELGENYSYYEHFKTATEMKGIQTRLPFDIEIY